MAVIGPEIEIIKGAGSLSRHPSCILPWFIKFVHRTPHQTKGE